MVLVLVVLDRVLVDRVFLDKDIMAVVLAVVLEVVRVQQAVAVVQEVPVRMLGPLVVVLHVVVVRVEALEVVAGMEEKMIIELVLMKVMLVVGLVVE